MSILVGPLLPDEFVWSLGARIFAKYPCLAGTGLRGGLRWDPSHTLQGISREAHSGSGRDEVQERT